MAIFAKAYKGYDGPVSAPVQRLLVIFRYGLADVFRSRLFIGFYAICFLLPVALLCGLFVYHNLDLLLAFEVDLDDISYIDGSVFAILMQSPQLFLIFVMVMTIGPTMISPDMRNNAMPLFLSRPISRTNYILGKLLVLLFLGSLISWVPALFLFGVQSYLEGNGWLWDNLHIPMAAVVTSVTWIVSLSLVAFAVSAYIRVKSVARMMFFGLIFFVAIVGDVIQDIFGGWQFSNMVAAMQSLVAELYQVSMSIDDFDAAMPIGPAFSLFAAVIVVCMFVLSQRIRAYQVVS